MQVKKILRLFQYHLIIPKHEVDSRYGNLKFINNDEFIFLAIIKSPKHLLLIS